METLDQEYLERIFAYLTPVEWVQVSQVCQLWKTAAERLWKTITIIDSLSTGFIIANKPVIAADVAAKIVLCAAPFVKILEVSKEYQNVKNTSVELIKFGAYEYKVENFSQKKMLKLLQKKSTKITELHYADEVFDEKLLLFLARIFQKNKIKKFTAQLDGSAVRMEWFQIFLTESVEELDLVIYGISTGTFEDCFPNLKKLELFVKVDDPEVTLSAILPYVSGITSLHLKVDGKKCITLSKNLLWNITKMTELEVLRIDFCEAEVKCLDHFVNELAVSCLKLRSVKLTKTDCEHSGWNITTSALRSLMLFPNLEELYLSPVEGFGSIFLPQMEKLTDFSLQFKKQSIINIKRLCCAVKQMPMLQTLIIRGLVSKEQKFQLVWEMAVHAALQEKNVAVFRQESYHDYDLVFNRLKISRKNLTLKMLIEDQEGESNVDDVKAFMEANMKRLKIGMTIDYYTLP